MPSDWWIFGASVKYDTSIKYHKQNSCKTMCIYCKLSRTSIARTLMAFFIMANSNSFLSPYEILPIAQENKNLGNFSNFIMELYKKGKRKVPQSQAVILPRHQEEEETDKIKQAQIEQTYKKQ